MATYYNGASEIQSTDGLQLQTLVLMNPGYLYNYSHLSQKPTGNLMFLDHSNHPGNNPPVNNHHHDENITAANPSPPPSAQNHQYVSASPPSSLVHYMYNPVEMVARDITPFQQGLSLSLSSQQSRFRSQASGLGFKSHETAVILNSKYVKVTQEILEEVVNVGKLAVKNSDQSTNNLKTDIESSPVIETIKSGELSTGERQEIQVKKAKLVNMLDEVEQRYKQYHHEMQMVVLWFEQAAGIGSAKTYTSLALQTISKQLRSLKDAITGQIKAAARSLGEEEGSQMKFRQQRALQQLGMIQHNAWRPQRGLPERSVSVLRAWLFEHFLHPYPKDSDKIMLAKQTGLTRSQVSNWFINARVRLWKPMVEEMYLEEVKEQEQSGKEDDESNKIDEKEEHGKTESPENSNFRQPKLENSFNQTATGTQFQNPSGFSLIGSLPMDGFTQFSPKKPRNNDVGFTVTAGNSTDFMTGLGGYPVSDQLQQSYCGNRVSLTLGLPHCENVSISGTHQSFLSHQNIQLRRREEFGEEDDYTAMNPPSSSAVYESMNIQNRKRFAAQLVPDFVA